MKTRKFETLVKEYNENGEVVAEQTSVSLELTPDDDKCFVDKRNDYKIVRQSDGKGAVIEIPEEDLEFYEEILLI